MRASFDNVPVASDEFALAWSAAEHKKEEAERALHLGTFINLNDNRQGCSRRLPKAEPLSHSDDDDDYSSMYRRLGLGGH
jgi:hypothetical protein